MTEQDKNKCGSGRRDTGDLIREIRAQQPVQQFREGMSAGNVTRPLSRWCSVFFIRHNVTPNQVTLLMTLFGIIGSVLFAFPCGWLKLLGCGFWFLWYTMDLSDGQVARYTRRFSKYGTEMDYMAHLIDHPLMNLALWWTFIGMDLASPLLVSAIFILVISMELIYRSLVTMEHYQSKAELRPAATPPVRGWVSYFIHECTLFPNLIVCFTWIVAVDWLLHAGFSIWLLYAWATLFVVYNAAMVVGALRRFFRN